MTGIDGALREALTPIVGLVKPNLYDGAATEYIVFNYDEVGVLNADDRPRAVVYRVMVHLYLPHGENPQTKKNAIREALHDAGATWPEITNASDSEGQHYVFEFEMMEGNEPDGDQDGEP